MTRLLLNRLLQWPLIMLAIFAVTFALAWLVPGSPLDQPEGRRPPPAIEEAMRAQYRLDNPIAFASDYLAGASGLDWLRGRRDRPFDLGPSLRHPDWSVNEILAAGLPVSLTLGLAAILIGIAIGSAAGLAGGLRPDSGLDLGTQLVALLGISVPPFVVGSALLLWLGVGWRWVPIGGWGDPGHIVLPALTLSLPMAAYVARLLRYGLIEQMATDHLRTARAKGLSRLQAAWRHAMRNAFLPVLSFLGPASAAVLTGSFVVEKVFAVPGIGKHFVEAVLAKDLTLIMGIVLVYSTLLVALNLAVDLLYRWVDPRIEWG
jgi:oligopeptide transport system permease protein